MLEFMTKSMLIAIFVSGNTQFSLKFRFHSFIHSFIHSYILAFGASVLNFSVDRSTFCEKRILRCNIFNVCGVFAIR